MSAARGYAEVAEDLRQGYRYRCKSCHTWTPKMRLPDFAREAAALLAGVAATLPDCPTCGGTGTVIESGVFYKGCPLRCVDGKVTVAQLAALWDAVHGDDFEGDGSYPHTDDFLARLRSVPSPSPKGAT